MNEIKKSPSRIIPFVHCYLIVNIYTMAVVDEKPLGLDKARKLRDKLNANYKHPAHYPKDAKDPYIIVVIREGEVVD
jgi:hypothetical protein